VRVGTRVATPVVVSMLKTPISEVRFASMDRLNNGCQ